jgi:hypothetical protein
MRGEHPGFAHRHARDGDRTDADADEALHLVDHLVNNETDLALDALGEDYL